MKELELMEDALMKSGLCIVKLVICLFCMVHLYSLVVILRQATELSRGSPVLNTSSYVLTFAASFHMVVVGSLHCDPWSTWRSSSFGFFGWSFIQEIYASL